MNIWYNISKKHSMILCEMTNRNAQEGSQQRITSTDSLMALIFRYKCCLNWAWNCKSTTWVIKQTAPGPYYELPPLSEKKDCPIYSSLVTETIHYCLKPLELNFNINMKNLPSVSSQWKYWFSTDDKVHPDAFGVDYCSHAPWYNVQLYISIARTKFGHFVRWDVDENWKLSVQL